MKKWKNIFLYGLAIELVEEVLEEFIAFIITGCIAWVVTKAVSTLIVFGLTQGSKIVIKRIVKLITYKEGNDKVSKIKSFFSWVWANKCTLGGVATGALFVASGVGAIDVNSFPELIIGGFNITPVFYYGVLGILSVVCSFFPESFEKFAKRVAEKKAEKEQKAINKKQEKEQKAIEKEAKKEIIAEAKKANQSQAQAEKEVAKEKAQAEHRAKVEAEKAKLLAKK